MAEETSRLREFDAKVKRVLEGTDTQDDRGNHAVRALKRHRNCLNELDKAERSDKPNFTQIELSFQAQGAHEDVYRELLGIMTAKYKLAPIKMDD